IGAPAVLQLLRDVERRGSIETARRIRQRISAVFAFAIAEGIVDQDPAAIVGKALRPPAPTKRQPALLELAQVRKLFDDCDRAGGPPIVRLASRFLALTAVRMGALLGMSWDEVEQLDGDAPLWRVPAARMKLARAKKDDCANDHIVPLSAEAVEVLNSARALLNCGAEKPESQKSGLIFSIRPAAIGALYKRAGYHRRHVPHGWRASFSTIMNERFPEQRAAIDMALAHTPKGESESEGAYNRASFLKQRRTLFQKWGSLLIS
ncbi:MAG TPA: tyrosine-type recombinase/integrase, partial [Sphingobium sp.]